VEQRDSIYKSDDSEAMRRLKMKWQTKLIEQKSDYGKLIADHKLVQSELAEVDGQFNTLLVDHTETVDDLERHEQEIEGLRRNGGGGIWGEINLMQLANMLKSGQLR